jgi:hypothetical protein
MPQQTAEKLVFEAARILCRFAAQNGMQIKSAGSARYDRPLVPDLGVEHRFSAAC